MHPSLPEPPLELDGNVLIAGNRSMPGGLGLEKQTNPQLCEPQPKQNLNSINPLTLWNLKPCKSKPTMFTHSQQTPDIKNTPQHPTTPRLRKFFPFVLAGCCHHLGSKWTTWSPKHNQYNTPFCWELMKTQDWTVKMGERIRKGHIFAMFCIYILWWGLVGLIGVLTSDLFFIKRNSLHSVHRLRGWGIFGSNVGLHHCNLLRQNQLGIQSGTFSG